MSNKVKLLDEQIKFLESLPEQGMGYQIVDIKLKNGNELLKRIVVNSTYLTLLENESINPSEIESIKIHNNKEEGQTMTAKELYNIIKKESIPADLKIATVADAVNLHDKVFIPFRVKLYENGLNGFMPHYRGEQKFGWDILPGVFRPPLTHLTREEGRQLEEKAIKEFEEVVETKIGSNVLRKIFNHETYGKTWDLLFQAQHAGVRTTLTDWTAFIVSALYFATEKSIYEDVEKSDAQLWCLMVPEENIISDSQFFPKESMYNLNPFDVDNVYLINPSVYIDQVEERLFEYNMYKQKGRFVILPNSVCNIPINKQDLFSDFLFQIRIKAGDKAAIREELAARGITSDYLFYEKNKDSDQLIRDINHKVYGL